MVQADFLAAYCPVEEARSFSVLELKTQSLSLEDTEAFLARSWRLVKDRAFLGAEGKDRSLSLSLPYTVAIYQPVDYHICIEFCIYKEIKL